MYSSLGLGLVISSSLELFLGLFLSFGLRLSLVAAVVLLIFGERFKEFAGNLFELGFETLSNLVLCLVLGTILSGHLLLAHALVDLELLLTAELTVENSLHDFFLLRLESVIVQGAAKLDHVHGTVTVTNRGHLALHLDAGKNSVGNLHGVSDFVLAVEEIPHIKETVHAGQVEKTATLGRPATVSQVALMVAGLHNGLTELLGPNFGGPVTNRKEVLELGGVTLEGVDGAVMLAILKTVTNVDFDLVLTSVSLHDVALFATDQVLHGGSLGVVLEGGSTANLGEGRSSDGVSVV
jgi:hypothetical protein